MATVRTNITLPEETLALVDAVAGPRGRSRYIADVVHRQVRRDNARMVFETYAGFLKGSTTWGATPEETLQILRELRDDSERERTLWGPYETETPDAPTPGHDGAGRPRERMARSGRPRQGTVQRAE